MKIFFLINSLDTGGSERVVATLARDFAQKKGISVKVFTLNGVKKQELGKAGYIALSKTKSHKSYFFMAPLLAARFKKILRMEKPDAVISFLELSNLININAVHAVNAANALEKNGGKQGVGIKGIISVRANPSFVYESGLYGAVFRRLIRKHYPAADLVITNSRLSKMDLARNFSVNDKKIKVVYNPLDISAIEKKAREPLGERYEDIFRKRDVIVNVGRLHYLKGQEYLLESFAGIKKNVPEACLVLIGNGELKKKLEDKARKLGVSKSVFFLGEQENPYKFVARSKVFAFTSLYEGFPNAVLEAMACGTPVVSVDCRSGPREMLAPKTYTSSVAKGVELAEFGVLVPPFGGVKPGGEMQKREEILEKAIIKVLNVPRLQDKYSAAGKKRAMSFDVKKKSLEFFNAIEEVLKRS